MSEAGWGGPVWEGEGKMRLCGRLVQSLSMLAMLTAAGLPTTALPLASGSAGSAFVEVPLYTQQRNLSCEYASLVIAMGAYDTWVSEWTFDELVPVSDNPHWGYRGDINGAWGNTTDYGVYPEPLVEPLAQLGFRGEVFYAQGDEAPLQRYLDNGVPVVLWLGLWGDQSYYEYASDGTPYKMNPGYHVVVAYGYDESGSTLPIPPPGAPSPGPGATSCGCGTPWTACRWRSGRWQARKSRHPNPRPKSWRVTRHPASAADQSRTRRSVVGYQLSALAVWPSGRLARLAVWPSGRLRPIANSRRESVWNRWRVGRPW